MTHILDYTFSVNKYIYILQVAYHAYILNICVCIYIYICMYIYIYMYICCTNMICTSIKLMVTHSITYHIHVHLCTSVRIFPIFSTSLVVGTCQSPQLRDVGQQQQARWWQIYWTQGTRHQGGIWPEMGVAIKKSMNGKMGKLYVEWEKKVGTHGTVDGRNPAPVGR